MIDWKSFRFLWHAKHEEHESMSKEMHEEQTDIDKLKRRLI